MNEIDFINKWSPNGFENPYQNYCFESDLEKLRKQIRVEVIDECIEIVRNTYRMDALVKLEQLKEQK